MALTSEPEQEPGPESEGLSAPAPAPAEQRAIVALTAQVHALTAQLHAAGMEPDVGKSGWGALQQLYQRAGSRGTAAAAAASSADAMQWNRLHSAKLMKAQVASVGTIRELRQALAGRDEQLYAKDQRIGELLALLEAQSASKFFTSILPLLVTYGSAFDSPPVVAVLARLRGDLARLLELQKQPRPGRLAVVTRNADVVIDDEMGGEREI